MAHAPYVAHWLPKSGALHLFDDKLRWPSGIERLSLEL